MGVESLRMKVGMTSVPSGVAKREESKDWDREGERAAVSDVKAADRTRCRISCKMPL